MPFDPGWHFEDDRDGTSPRAVAWWFDGTGDEGGHVVAYSFGLIDRGVIDLVGFMIVGAADVRAAWQIVREWSHEAAKSDRPGALTSRRLRTAASQRGLLQQARSILAADVTGELGGQDGRNDFAASWLRVAHPQVGVQRGGRQRTVTDEFLAAVVIEYSALLADGEGGARKRLADRRHVSDAAAKRWIDLARQRGLWRTSGPGKPGQPTERAFEIVRAKEQEP